MYRKEYNSGNKQADKDKAVLGKQRSMKYELDQDLTHKIWLIDAGSGSGSGSGSGRGFLFCMLSSRGYCLVFKLEGEVRGVGIRAEQHILY